MTKSRINVNVDTSGPLFNGQISQVIHDWLDATKREMADQGVRELDAFTMDKSGRGTGNYQEHIRTSTLSYNDIRIDDPVVYGPWLEGMSKRNSSTRFKGYHLWRKTRQRLRRTYKDVAQTRLNEYITRMGGVP